jgi:hypothetical protein
MTSSVFANVRRGMISMFIGLASSFAVASIFLNASSYSAIDQSLLVVVPALALAACIYAVLPYLEALFLHAATSIKVTFLALTVSTALVVLLPIFDITDFDFYPAFISLSFAILALMLPAAPSVQKSMDDGMLFRLLGRWLFSTILTFLFIGFLDDFYTSVLEILSLILLLQVMFSTLGDLVLEKTTRLYQKDRFDAGIMFVLCLMLILFAGAAFNSNQNFPLFPTEHYTLHPNLFSFFFSASLLALPWLAWLDLQTKSKGLDTALKTTKFYLFIERNLPGLVLASLFLGIYLLNASVINHPRFDVDDIYFDADGLNYRIRLTTDTWRDYYWRSVHPFMILLLKPPVDLISFFLKGDKLFGVYLFVSGAGAACVYLAWAFIKEGTKNPVYASLIAALLGLSTSHLFFGSFIESYIFLAASLLLFYVLLIKDRPFPALVMAGLAAIGITHSNFAQNVIAFFSVKFNIKQTIRFVATVLVFLVLLTLLNNLLYPEAHPFFFIPSTLQAEGSNLYPLNRLRIQGMARAFLLHNVIAPTPILHTGEIPFVQFRFFKPEIDKLSQYTTPLQNSTVSLWLGLLALAGLLFVKDYKKNLRNGFYYALAGGMILNAGLHLHYGKELFLYSPNWTYSVVLLVGMAWQPVSGKRWFQIVLLVLLSLVAFNNHQLFLTFIEILIPQI